MTWEMYHYPFRTPIDPMLALGSSHGIRWPAAIERKYDGIRAIVHRTRNGTSIQTRGGHDYSNRYPSLLMELHNSLPFGVYDGEIYHPTEGGNGSAQTKAKEGQVNYAIFDLPNDASPYLFRRFRLASLLKINSRRIHISEMRICTSRDEATALLYQYVCNGMEGCVAKPVDGLYMKGQRTDWVKLKINYMMLPQILEKIKCGGSQV